MKRVAVENTCVLYVDGGTATATGYVTNQFISVDNLKCCHQIPFTVSLSSGATGAGTIVGTSSYNFGDNLPFVLEGDFAMCETIQPGTPPTPGPVVKVEVKYAGQNFVEMD